jgi:hypothetical protein
MNLKMEALPFSETLLKFCQNIPSHISQHGIDSSESFKSKNTKIFSCFTESRDVSNTSHVTYRAELKKHVGGTTEYPTQSAALQPYICS